jgi:hypothetical protein
VSDEKKQKTGLELLKSIVDLEAHKAAQKSEEAAVWAKWREIYVEALEGQCRAVKQAEGEQEVTGLVILTSTKGGGFSLRSIYSEGKARPGLLAAAHCVISDLVGDMRADSRSDPLPPKEPDGDKP